MRKQDKYITEEQKEIQNFFKILIGLVIIVGLFYVLTVFVVNKEEPYKRTNNKGTIQYSSILLGTLLNRSDSEYYVLALDSTDKANSYIINKASTYSSKEGKLPLYTADLSLEFNKNFIGEENNYSIDNIEDLKLSGTTLMKIKDKKIVKFISDISLIEAELD